jgi:hypothetical protein
VERDGGKKSIWGGGDGSGEHACDMVRQVNLNMYLGK